MDKHTASARSWYTSMRTPMFRGNGVVDDLNPVTIVRVGSEAERERVLALEKPPGMSLHVIVEDAARPQGARNAPEPEVFS